MASQLAQTLLAVPEVHGISIVLEMGGQPTLATVEVKEPSSILKFVRLSRAMTSAQHNILGKIQEAMTKATKEAESELRDGNEGGNQERHLPTR